MRGGRFSGRHARRSTDTGRAARRFARCLSCAIPLRTPRSMSPLRLRSGRSGHDETRRSHCHRRCIPWIERSSWKPSGARRENEASERVPLAARPACCQGLGKARLRRDARELACLSHREGTMTLDGEAAVPRAPIRAAELFTESVAEGSRCVVHANRYCTSRAMAHPASSPAKHAVIRQATECAANQRSHFREQAYPKTA